MLPVSSSVIPDCFCVGFLTLEWKEICGWRIENKLETPRMREWLRTDCFVVSHQNLTREVVFFRWPLWLLIIAIWRLYFPSSSGLHMMCIISSTIQTCLLLKNSTGLTVKYRLVRLLTPVSCGVKQLPIPNYYTLTITQIPQPKSPSPAKGVCLNVSLGKSLQIYRVNYGDSSRLGRRIGLWIRGSDYFL